MLALIGIVLIAGLVMTKDYAVEREITINQPKDSVFNYVKMMKNQDSFSVWNMKFLTQKEPLLVPMVK